MPVDDLAWLRKGQRAHRASEGRRDIWLAIMIAAYEGKGLQLSADEVFRLSADEAVAQSARDHTEVLLGEQ